MATREQLVLDGTALDSATGSFALAELQMPPPRKRAEWAMSGDSDGAALVRDPLFENREITAKLRVRNQVSMDAALSEIGTVVAKLEEAERQENGLALVWTPVNSTKSLTAYVLSGEVEEFPIDRESGWFDSSPVLSVKMVCKPFLYGAEVTGSPTSSSDPLVTVTVASATGDVPAEGRLIVTDNATQTRRHVEWGLENRHYNAANSLILDSDSLTATGYSGSGTTRSGAYDPGAAGDSVIRGTLVDTPVAVCATLSRTDVGVFRVKGRVYASNATAGFTKVRLSWQHGDGPFQANPWVSPPVGANWAEVDLGVISIPEKVLGTQRWVGKVEAFTDGGVSGTDTLDVDVLYLIPAGEGYGKATAPWVLPTPTSFSARDEFDQSAGALTSKTLPVGGTWSGAGDADDFSVETTGKTAQRTAVSDSTTTGRFATASTPTLTTCAVQADVKFSTYLLAGQGVLARYVDTSNYLLAFVGSINNGAGGSMTAASVGVAKVVAGAVTLLGSSSQAAFSATGTWHTVKLFVDAQGRVYVGGPNNTFEFVAYDSALATGGTLASGKVGIFDIQNSATAHTRNMDNFRAWVPDPPAAVYSGQSVEIRHDSAIREDSTGTYWGPVPSYRGSRFLLPPAGDESRTSRIAVKARRNDVDEAADDNIADSTTVQVNYTPRYLVAPR